MSKQTHELTIGQQITVGNATVTVTEIGQSRQGDQPPQRTVTIEIVDAAEGGE